MQKKALLALLLALVMGLTGCALIEKDLEVDRATEIIRVGDTVITKGTVQNEVLNQLNYMAQYYSAYGQKFDSSNPDTIKKVQTTVVNAMVEEEVKKQKAAATGMNNLTEEEEKTLQEKVDNAWQNIQDRVKTQFFKDTELEGEALDAAVVQKAEELGYTRATVEEQERSTFVVDKLETETVKDVAVSDDEIKATYDLKVQEAKTKYESNLSAYGTAVNGGQTVYYRPAGYRMTKQILVRFLAEDKALMDQLNSAINEKNTLITSINKTLTSLEVTNADELTNMVTVDMAQPAAEEGSEKLPVSTLATVSNLNNTLPEDTNEEVAHQVQQLAIARQELAFFAQQLENAKKNAYANIAEKADDIIAQLKDGGDWDTIMAANTEDPGMQGDSETAKRGYAVCADFSGFDSAYTTAAMALEKVGDVSPKTEGMYGYYIIQYTSQVEEGAVPLEDVRSALYDELLKSAKEQTWKDAVAQWVKEANAKIDMGALNN